MTSGSKSGRPATKYGCWYSTILMLPLFVLLIFLKLQSSMGNDEVLQLGQTMSGRVTNYCMHCARDCECGGQCECESNASPGGRRDDGPHQTRRSSECAGNVRVLQGGSRKAHSAGNTNCFESDCVLSH